MNTSDRQITETGRNRELGLIPAMVMAIIAALSGAGVSFAPLYERIWGGMMLHPNCPTIGRMTYYLSGQATGDYGACVTSPLWFLAVTALSVVAIICLTVAGVQGFARHRLRTVICVFLAAVAVAFILVLSANTKIVMLWAIHAATWLVYAILAAYSRNSTSIQQQHIADLTNLTGSDKSASERGGWSLVTRLLLVWQIGMMPVLITEYSVSDEVNSTGGVTIACGLGLAAYALVHLISIDIPRDNVGSALPTIRDIRPVSVHKLFRVISINASAVSHVSVPLGLFWAVITFLTYSYGTGGHTDFCPALAATNNAGLIAVCTGSGPLIVLAVLLYVLPIFSLVSAIATVMATTGSMSNSHNSANSAGFQDKAAIFYLLLTAVLSATAFIIAFTLA